MKRHWKMALIVLGVLVVGFGCWFVTRPKEPVFLGKSFSQWFAELPCPTNRSVRDEPAFLVIVAMGEDSAPLLLRKFQWGYSPLRESINRFVNRFSGGRLGKEDYIGWKAELCIERLGSRAECIVQDLAAITSDPHSPCRAKAADLLGSIHALPPIAVPALVAALKNSDRPGRSMTVTSADALAEFGAFAKSAIPELLSTWRDSPSKFERDALADAIKKIDPEAAKKAGIK